MTREHANEDVLEQHGDDRGRRLRPWARRAAVAAALLAGGALVADVRLPTGDRRTPESRDAPRSARSATGAATPAVTILARHGSRLVRYSPGGATQVATLPRGFGANERLWAVDDGRSRVLYGVRGRDLFRVGVRHGRVVADVGTVDRIVDVGPGPGELVVQLSIDDGTRVSAIDGATGNVVHRDPFPAFDGSGGWTPRAVLTTFGLPGLVLTRTSAGGRGDEVALAWTPRGISSGFVPAGLQRLGRPGRLLGVAGDWVLFLDEDCPSPGCVATVLSFTRDGARLRSVSPPPGWSFVPGNTAGQSHEALVPVAALSDHQVHALARVVAGGDRALLLRDSVGLQLSAGVVAEPDGSVYFLLTGRVVARWSPAHLPRVVTFPELPRVPTKARLVCACD